MLVKFLLSCLLSLILFPAPILANTPYYGDTDGDGDVDQTDFSNFLEAYGRSGTSSDFDQSGLVDLYDYNILVTTFQTSPPPPPPTGSDIGPLNLSYRQGGLWLTPAEIAAIPTNNASWDSLVEFASMTPDMYDLICTAGGNGTSDCPDSQASRILYAKTIVGLRTGNQGMLAEVKFGLDQVDEVINRAIDVYENDDEKWAQRNLGLLAVSANILNYRPSDLTSSLHKAVYLTKFDGNRITIRDSALRGLTNKPGWGRWSLLTTAYLLEDWDSVNLVIQAHAKALGEPDWNGAPNPYHLQLSGTGSEDDWQTLQRGGKDDPLAVMPVGIYYQDHGVGGLWLADQYRSGNGPVWPPAYTNYIYEGLASYVAVSFAADHLGYAEVFELGDYALLRTLLFAYSSHDGKPSWPAEGNDLWQIPAVMTWATSEFGNNLPDYLKPEPNASIPWPLPVDDGGRPGRGMGFMYATHYARLLNP